MDQKIVKKHVQNLIEKTGFKKSYIAKKIGITSEQLSKIINCRRKTAQYRESIFNFLELYLNEIETYRDVWLEDRPGTLKK